MLSVGVCALYTVLTRRWMLDDTSLAVVLAQQVAALAFAVALASLVELAGGAGWSLTGLEAGTWIGAGVSGLLYYGLGFWFFLAGLRHVPASYAGAFLPLIPVFGVAAGFLIGERLEPWQWVGAVIVVIATVAVVRHEPEAGSNVALVSPHSTADRVSGGRRGRSPRGTGRRSR